LIIFKFLLNDLAHWIKKTEVTFIVAKIKNGLLYPINNFSAIQLAMLLTK